MTPSSAKRVPAHALQVGDVVLTSDNYRMSVAYHHLVGEGVVLRLEWAGGQAHPRKLFRVPASCRFKVVA